MNLNKFVDLLEPIAGVAKMDSRKEPDIKSCGVLVFRQKPVQSFLLMKHADRWDLPKGHVDQGETEIECALRELLEETGIRADDICLDAEFRFSHWYQVSVKRFNYAPRSKELVVFLGTLLTDVELQLTEHIGSEWIEWKPPHEIQANTIDPLLAAVSEHWSASGR